MVIQTTTPTLYIGYLPPEQAKLLTSTEIGFSDFPSTCVGYAM